MVVLAMNFKRLKVWNTILIPLIVFSFLLMVKDSFAACGCDCGGRPAPSYKCTDGVFWYCEGGFAKIGWSPWQSCAIGSELCRGFPDCCGGLAGCPGYYSACKTGSCPGSTEDTVCAVYYDRWDWGCYCDRYEGKFDGKEGKCVVCDAYSPIEVKIMADTTTIYPRDEPKEGDKECESACGAPADLDETPVSKSKIKDLSCPSVVNVGDPFNISFYFKGTDYGTAAPGAYWWQVISIYQGSKQEACNVYDKDACTWNYYSKTLIAPGSNQCNSDSDCNDNDPSTIDKCVVTNTSYTYKVRVMSGTSSDAYQCNYSDSYMDEIQNCSIIVNRKVCSYTKIQPVIITIDSSPQGLTIEVDKVPYRTPSYFEWLPGSSHNLSAPSPNYLKGKPAIRFIFLSWSDGGSQTHSIITPSYPATYTAYYAYQVYLNVTANNPSWGNISGAGWYNYGANASISASPYTCYLFKNWTANWSGGYTGTANPATVKIDMEAILFADKGNTPTQTANFDYNNGAPCGTKHCSKSATHSSGDECKDITCDYVHYGTCSNGNCVYQSENCDNYDNNYCRCAVYGSKLREECRDYECVPLFGNVCAWTGDWIVKNEWTCDSTKVNTKQSCNNTDYWCCYDNGYKWQTTPCGACSYSLSITPEFETWSDTTKTWNINVTDSSNSHCISPITYSISYSTSGSCDSASTGISTNSFSINRGSTLTNAFSVTVKRAGTSCTLDLKIKDPNGNTVATGSYNVSGSVTCTPGDRCKSECDGSCGRKVYVYDSSCNCVYSHTENCPVDTSCSAGQCLSSVACLIQNECEDPCTKGQKLYRCDGFGNCNKFWQLANTQTCNPFGCSAGSCTDICNAACGADLECDGKKVGSDCGTGGTCDASCKCIGSTQADFDIWTGIGELSVTVGQAFPVSIYVKNTGLTKDSYNFSVTTSSNVQARVYDKEISNVLPGSVVSTKVEIKVFAFSSQGEEVKVLVTSKSSRRSKEITIKLKIGSSSMSDLDVFSIVLIIGVSVIFLIKRMYSNSM
ncbi:MAG: hypothetical protein QXX07_00240 [Candidatus Aenigmatarchaeota archaeon]